MRTKYFCYLANIIDRPAGGGGGGKLELPIELVNLL